MSAFEQGRLPWAIRYLYAAALIAAVGVGWKAEGLRPIVNPAIRDQTLDIGESHASASLLGQFRTTTSGWLWLKADLYLHNGVEMRPLSEEELANGITVDNAKDDGHEKLHAENEITAVPSASRDFRGVFGDVERQVASYKDMHDHVHNDPQIAMPLYRLMTWIDPQFIDGWTMGGMILARDRSEDGTNRALTFLREGWGQNPESVDILSQIGTTLAFRGRPLPDAIKFLEAARYIGFSHRHDLQENDREALRTAYHVLAFCYRGVDEHQKELATVKEAMEVFKDDPLLPKLLVKAQEAINHRRAS